MRSIYKWIIDGLIDWLRVDVCPLQFTWNTCIRSTTTSCSFMVLKFRRFQLESVRLQCFHLFIYYMSTLSTTPSLLTCDYYYYYFYLVMWRNVCGAVPSASSKQENYTNQKKHVLWTQAGVGSLHNVRSYVMGHVRCDLISSIKILTRSKKVCTIHSNQEWVPTYSDSKRFIGMMLPSVCLFVSLWWSVLCVYDTSYVRSVRTGE